MEPNIGERLLCRVGAADDLRDYDADDGWNESSVPESGVPADSHVQMDESESDRKSESLYEMVPEGASVSKERVASLMSRRRRPHRKKSRISVWLCRSLSLASLRHLRIVGSERRSQVMMLEVGPDSKSSAERLLKAWRS